MACAREHLHLAIDSNPTICHFAVHECSLDLCLQDLIERRGLIHDVMVQHDEVRPLARCERPESILGEGRVRRVERHALECLETRQALRGIPM